MQYSQRPTTERLNREIRRHSDAVVTDGSLTGEDTAGVRVLGPRVVLA